MPARRTYAPWTAAQIKTLQTEWHDTGVRTLLRKLAPHTWCGIRLKAKQLGLPNGVPQGCESIESAARRLGVDRWAVLRIAESAGVAVRRVYPAADTPPNAQAVHRTLYVERDAIDEAFGAWCDTESVRAAARRLGVSDRAMLGWVRRAGLVPANHQRGHIIRLPSETYERLYAEGQHRLHRRAAA